MPHCKGWEIFSILCSQAVILCYLTWIWYQFLLSLLAWGSTIQYNNNYLNSIYEPSTVSASPSNIFRCLKTVFLIKLKHLFLTGHHHVRFHCYFFLLFSLPQLSYKSVPLFSPVPLNTTINVLEYWSRKHDFSLSSLSFVL